MPATDRIGMNAAVQRALQAMLAIDPSLGNMPSSMEQPDDLSSPVSFQVRLLLSQIIYIPPTVMTSRSQPMLLLRLKLMTAQKLVVKREVWRR